MRLRGNKLITRKSIHLLLVGGLMLMFLFILSSICVQMRAAAGVLEDFDSLGGNKELLHRAQALNPQTQIDIVQNRIVERSNRHEFYPEYGNVLGGDIYLNTQYLGMGYQYHLNPHWSAGLKYSYYFNELASEGHRLINKFGYIPALDWPKQSLFGTINYYPLYGKFNWFGRGVVHFDFYLLGGWGKVQIKSGETSGMTAGVGAGFWISQYLTTRLEMRYLTYSSDRQSGAKDMKLNVLNMSFGYLL